MNLQCKMCGGSVEVMPGNKLVGTCRFCGSTMTLPKLGGDADAAAFNYANELRRHCDFDGAISAYRDILARDHANAEAYWGICLSRYGVEYVQDPKSQKRLPTLHRLNRKRVVDDTDYRFALKYAEDEKACQLYRDEAARIDQIRADALKLVNNEPPYDVFICYKEREERGGLTEDYGLAQSIYNKLDKLGYRVFFAHITLLGKLGEAYEPCIYAALNSAKVMLVVATRPEHVNAVWVRNEWSRYLAITEEEPGKRLVVCTRGMDPYSLPEELKYLQAMNLSDLNALESIVATVRQAAGVPGVDPGPAARADERPGAEEAAEAEAETATATATATEADRQLNDLRGAMEVHKKALSRHQAVMAALASDIAAADKSLTTARKNREDNRSKIKKLRFTQFIRLLLLLACAAVFAFGWMSAKYGIFAARDRIALWPEWCRSMALGVWDFILAKAKALGIPAGSFHLLRPIAGAIGFLLILRRLFRGRKIRALKRQRAGLEEAVNQAEAQINQLTKQRDSEAEAARQSENEIAKINSKILALQRQISRPHQVQSGTYMA